MQPIFAQPSSNVTALLRSQRKPQPVVEDPPAYAEDAGEPPIAATRRGSGGGTKPPAKPKSKRRVSDILLLVLAISLIVGGATYGVFAMITASNQPTSPDMMGNRVQGDDPSMYDEETLKEMDAVEDLGLKFIIDVVDLNVPLGEVNEVKGVINPPGFKSAFLIRNRGVGLANADQGTVYVAAHSLRSPGVAPGNFVINISAGNITVPVGSEIQVGGRTYVMTASSIIDKKELGADERLWANTPGMLVFITCLQYTSSANYKNGHSPTNAVLIGQLVS